MRITHTVLIALLCTGISVAEEEKKNKDIPVVRVSARRFSDSTLSVPAAVTVIDRETITQSGATSLPALLQQKANLHIRSYSGNGNDGELDLRGFGENSGLRTLVIVDGHTMNSADMGGINWQQLPLSQIESVEILRGSQNVLYGNNALAGVVKITTRKGGQPGASLKTAAGSDGFRQLTASASGAWSNLFFRAGANWQTHDGWRDHTASWSRSANATIGCFINETDSLSIYANVGRSYQEFAGGLDYNTYKTDPTSTGINGVGDSEQSFSETTATWEGFRDWGQIHLNAGFSQRTDDWELDGTLGDSTQHNLTMAPKIRLGDDKQFITLGTELKLDRLKFEGENDTWVNEAELTRWTAGPFILTQQPLSENIKFSTGARYEFMHTDGTNLQYDKTHLEPYLPNPWGVLIPNPNYPAQPDADTSYDEAFNKRGWAAEAALNWTATETISLWGNIKQIYRYPAMDETASYQFFESNNAMNEDLDPETGQQVEIGIKYISGGKHASATLYCMQLDNQIVYDPVNFENVNLGATRRIGSELEIGYDTETAGASLMAQWIDAFFTGEANKGNQVPLVPELKTTLSAWVKPASRLRLSADWSWTSDQTQGGDDENTSRKIDAYSLVGLHGQLQCTKHCRIFMNINNLLDKQYAATVYSELYYPGAGRSINVGLEWEY